MTNKKKSANNMLLRCLISSLSQIRPLITRTNALNTSSLSPYITNIPACNLSRDIIYRNTVDSLSRSKSGFDKLKAKVILSLNFQSPEDALPFYKLPLKTLIHIQKTTRNDEHNNFCSNRLYYIASRIKVPSSELSLKLSKRVFIYSLSFEWIDKSLDALLDMGVAGDRIVRDLWVLKYHHKTIRERLERIQSMGIDHLNPWMVRCSEDILNRYISISLETKNILGESKTTQTYLANRLNISGEAVAEMCKKLPALKTIRVTKVKYFLDFLENEGFSIEDISTKLRVLSASQKTVKQRLDKLRQLGLNEINLNVLCRSKKDFKKYCESLQSASEESDKS